MCNSELEFNNRQTERLDELDNMTFDTICAYLDYPDQENFEWNMEIIGEVAECIEETLRHHGYRVYRPYCTINMDGKVEIRDYVEPVAK